MRPTQDVRPYEKNAKRHAKSQVRKVADSIREFGWAQPLAVDASGTLIVGHCRLEAAKLLGLKEVPVVVMDGLTAAQVRALRLADNRLNESAWDMGLVIEELKGLTVEALDLTGFSRDLVLEPSAGQDDAPTPPKRPVTRLGDVYSLGDHRLMCGDSTKGEDVARLMGGERADMVFTDPPYCLFGNSTGMSGISDDKMVSSFFLEVINACRLNTKVFGHAYVFCDWKSYAAWMRAAVEGEMAMKNLVVWDKGSGGLGSNYQSCHEFAIFLSNDPKRKLMAGKQAGCRIVRGKPNIWRYPRPKGEDRQHNAAKPVDMISEAIGNSSDKGETVLDLFGGSGSTIIACEKVGRKCLMMEMEPGYCDVIVTRWERMTGRKAKLLK